MVRGERSWSPKLYILTTFLNIHLQMEPWGMSRFNLWEGQCESLHPCALIQPKIEPDLPHSINCQNAAVEQRNRHMWNVIWASENPGLALFHPWWKQAHFQVNAPEIQMETRSLDGCHYDSSLLPYPDFFFIFSFVFRLFSFSDYKKKYVKFRKFAIVPPMKCLSIYKNLKTSILAK